MIGLMFDHPGRSTMAFAEYCNRATVYPRQYGPGHARGLTPGSVKSSIAAT